MSYLITRLLRICHIVFGLYAWLIFIALSLATTVLLAVTPYKPLRRMLTKGTSKLVFNLTGTRLDVTGIENIPNGASVIVANHSSYIDGVLLAAVLPARFSFVIKGGREGGKTLIENLELFSHLANIGDAKSLIIHPASTTHHRMDAQALQAAGVAGGMVRVSVGLEDPSDLIADLKSGLRAVEKQASN